MSKNLLMTGANGFVGQALCGEAVARGFNVRGATRKPCNSDSGAQNIVVGAIDGETDWSVALQGVDVVIHLAARVHVMHDVSSDPLTEFRSVNTAGTENLARQAARAGVKRLVYVSSIKVNGESTALSPSPSPADGLGELICFSDADTPNPQDRYGISKWEAEQALHRAAHETGLEVVIVRPPLVYGAGVKGNFAHMVRVVARGIPLPLGSVNNQRNLLYVGNLVDALISCATHPAAVGQTYLACDGEAVSTPELLRHLAVAMGVPSRVFPFPTMLLRLAGKLTGKSAQIERLLGSLQIDSRKIRHELDWQPPYTLEQGLQSTVLGKR